jgi:RND superfamily putative drug exporter
MATFLYRLGRFSYRRRWLVTGVWVLLLALAGVGATTLSGPISNAFSIPGTESQKALDLVGERMPGSGAGAGSARVVFVADSGQKVTSASAAAAIENAVGRLKRLPEVAAVSDPFATKTISQDGSTAYATVVFTIEAAELTAADQEELFAAGRSAESAGLRVEFGGDAAQQQPEQGATEAIGIAVAAVVLVITLGSLFAAGLPLLTAIVGVGVGLLGISIASGFADIASSTSALALMLGLAVGIDYALFIVSRHRHELLAGREPEEATGRAVGTAGSAVVFAGATVIIALAALTVVGIPFLAIMGLAAAGTVLAAVAIALTLLPALLGFLGTRVLGRKPITAPDSEPGVASATENSARAENPAAENPVRAPMGQRWAGFVVRRRIPVLLAVILGLGTIALPALDLRLGMPSDATAASDTSPRRAYDALAAGFGPGFNGPLIIAVDLAGATDRSAATQTIQADLTKLDDIAAVTPATTNPAGDLALITVIPTSGPTDLATEDLVHAIRTEAVSWQAATGAVSYVTGTTAVGIDISEKLSAALLPYLAVVVGLAFLLLMLVFRSVIVPLKATFGFLLSLAATFGAVVAVFQNGWLASIFGVDTTGPILSFLPILTIGVLFGLAMDYQVFLVTRMREEHVHGADAQTAVIAGFSHSARVVTAAAIIMTGVFAGFLLGHDPIIKSMGFALAFGVLFDAFLIRMTLVPAVMSLLGNRAWWMPVWLDRILPVVDVEGEKLTQLLARPLVPAQPIASPHDSTTAVTAATGGRERVS